jgi:hypothetical protein
MTKQKFLDILAECPGVKNVGVIFSDYSGIEVVLTSENITYWEIKISYSCITDSVTYIIIDGLPYSNCQSHMIRELLAISNFLGKNGITVNS